MKLGTEVGLDPGHIVLDGDRLSPPRKRGHSTRFSANVRCGQAAGWIKMPVPLCTEVGLGLSDSVLDGDPAPPPQKVAQPPTFRPMSIVAKRSPISATAELLF